MPKPESGETERDFLKRCIPELIHEGREQKQSVAICYSVYRKEGTEAKSPKPERHSSKHSEKKSKMSLELKENSLSQSCLIHFS